MLLREKFQKLFPNSFDALMYCHLGAVTHSTDFGIGVAIQRKQQKPLPLGGGAGIQNTENLVQRFLLAGQFLRGILAGHKALGSDYVGLAEKST
jgi:hypothetical protein